MKSAVPLPPGLMTPSAPLIMIVDDTLENLRLMKNMLGTQGFEVLAFPSGPLALRAAEKLVPDLVLLDISMPEMDGYQVCAHFKKDPRLANVPIIFLSAHTDIDDKVKAFGVGGVDFITKPFQYEEVHARVMTHLKIRSLQQHLKYQNDHLQQLVDAKVKELGEAHLESRRRLAQIAHMNRNITASVYSAALVHELNQPLAAILSNAEAAELFLDKDPPPLNEIREILADIRRDDRRAGDLIKRMRDLLKKSESEFQILDIGAVVVDVVKFLSGEARMRHVGVTVALAEDQLLVAADRVQLQQVVINLMLNSMDAMANVRQDQRAISIRTMSADSNQAEVVVQDSGTGFDMNIDHVFESFFTTKAQGMGLGLSITSEIIKAHGGHIRAENAPAGGAMITFKLPLQARIAG